VSPSAAADTIFALSSGALPAAVAIIRVSGPAAKQALETLAGSAPEPRVARVRALRGAGGALLDRALVLWFPGPATATGEDLAELHLHGGRAVVATVLSELGGVPGCRPAEAGEFTRRAFLNGRIDLSEAEGLADLLAAETEAARRQAIRMAEGGLTGVVERLRERLLGLAARAEAVLEFGDDEDDVAPDHRLKSDLADLARELRQTLKSSPAERLRDGFRVVVAGPPNSGKSSLINKISGRSVAIESPIAGTTRDLLEAPVILDGMAIILIDSAGLRATDEVIERLGIERAEQAITVADVLLWLGDEAAPRADAIRVHARCDLLGRGVMPATADVAISVKTGEGMEKLRNLLAGKLSSFLPATDMLLMTDRQRGLIASCAEHLEQAALTPIPEVASEDLRLGLRSLDQIVGRADVEAMLDALFGRFCIGK